MVNEAVWIKDLTLIIYQDAVQVGGVVRIGHVGTFGDGMECCDAHACTFVTSVGGLSLVFGACGACVGHFHLIAFFG